MDDGDIAFDDGIIITLDLFFTLNKLFSEQKKFYVSNFEKSKFVSRCFWQIGDSKVQTKNSERGEKFAPLPKPKLKLAFFDCQMLPLF